MSEAQTPEGAPDSDVPDRFTVDFTGLTLLGTYEVTKKLADGGMGSVYLGTDTNLNRQVVIKVPHVRFLGEPGFRTRFTREISELVRLEHPNIVGILAQGEHEEVPYFVLQFLGGGSLEDVFDAREGKGSPPEDYLPWLRTISGTLDFVHGRGTVHRDVKPANVLFDEEGHVFLSDFGVAKAMENEDVNLTEAGTGIGSPRYMAPEQGFGHELTPSADQYALASMVYEAVSGRPPFTEKSPVELLVKKGGSDPDDLCEVAPELPAEAGAAVMRALSREPEARHPSCAAFSEAFEDGLRPKEPETADETPRGRLLLVALALIPLLVVVFLLNKDKQPEGPADAATNEAGGMRLTLLDAGTEPRRPMRYVIPAGSRERVTLRIKQVTDMKIGGEPYPMPENPTVIYILDVVIDEVAKNGDLHLSWTTADVEFDEDTELPEALLEHLGKLKEGYKRFAGSAVMAPNGLTRNAELRGADGLTPAARGQLESVWWVVRNIAMAFPVEPVGHGARWEISETVDMIGMRLADTSTFELKKLDGDSFEITAFSAQTAAEQKMTTFGDIDTTLLSHHGRAKGGFNGDLAHLSPGRFQFAISMDMKMRFAGMRMKEEDEPEDMESDMHIDLEMRVTRD